MRVLIAAATLAALSTTAYAGTSNWFDPSLSNCATANCSSEPRSGTVTNPGGNVDPWTIGIFGRAGECIRLQVLQQGADLEATVVENDGTVFRNDDGGLPGCFLCSLVKFVATDTGWKTVNLSHFAGNPVYSDFRVSYGRYSGGAANANCTNPTAPAAVPAAAVVTKSGGSAPVTGDGTQ